MGLRNDLCLCRRIVVSGYPHHVTQRGVRSMNLFHKAWERREYLGMLGEEISRITKGWQGWPSRVSDFLLHSLDLVQSPSLSRGRIKWGAETRESESALAGLRLYPVLVVVFRSPGTVIEIDRASHWDLKRFFVSSVSQSYHYSVEFTSELVRTLVEFGDLGSRVDSNIKGLS
jgi:hypothetical protein